MFLCGLTLPITGLQLPAKRAVAIPVDWRVCAQHGRELMGCKSPVGVPTWTHREQG